MLAAFEAACQGPRRTQEELLRQIVEFHRDTDFGKDHGFRKRDALLWRRGIEHAVPRETKPVFGHFETQRYGLGEHFSRAFGAGT